MIVEARLAGDPAGLEIGMPMRLTLLPVWPATTDDVVTYAFEREEAAQ